MVTFSKPITPRTSLLMMQALTPSKTLMTFLMAVTWKVVLNNTTITKIEMEAPLILE